jgi:SAM-dependent methyltransferase
LDAWVVVAPLEDMRRSFLPDSSGPSRRSGSEDAVAQNIYDDDEFFRGYSGLQRSLHGLLGAPEWPSLQALLPSVAGIRVVDLGCGFGWFSRWAAESGATSVLGMDLSEKMLARARAENAGPSIEYRRDDLDHLSLEPAMFALAYSSLVLHYLSDLSSFLRAVFGALVPGGVFVFGIEHPIFTAPSSPGFQRDADGRSRWALDRYLDEGPRTTTWFTPGVTKQHRTITTYVEGLVDTGFVVDALVEWGPSENQVAANPAWALERERPQFLLIRAHRP